MNNFDLHFLGTGTSIGVPHLGCQCEVCRSTDPHDHRLRTSALLKAPTGRYILFDCGPDFRAQMLRFQRLHEQDWKEFSVGPYEYKLPEIAACLITHVHYDHVGGLDDLRPISYQHPIEICAEAGVASEIHRHMSYCFRENAYPGAPLLSLREIAPNDTLHIEGLDIQVLRVMHGELPIVGYRIGSMAYITDMTTAPEETMTALEGVRTLIINGLRWDRPHKTHQRIEDAVEICQRLKVERAWLIHMCHGAGFHASTNAKLPPHIQLAHDGLEVRLQDL